MLSSNKVKVLTVPKFLRFFGSSTRLLEMPQIIFWMKVALHFSAAWCPDCTRFAPKLKRWFEQNKKELVVILVSSDRDEKGFDAWLSQQNRWHYCNQIRFPG